LQSLPDYDAIIPMPLSPQRIRERGFNQVLELLSVIKRKQQVMIDVHSVHRRD
jgi:predicted amidophosphoribosyltransferase